MYNTHHWPIHITVFSKTKKYRYIVIIRLFRPFAERSVPYSQVRVSLIQSFMTPLKIYHFIESMAFTHTCTRTHAQTPLLLCYHPLLQFQIKNTWKNLSLHRTFRFYSDKLHRPQVYMYQA